MEVWKSIEEFDLYEISTLGRLRRKDSYVNSNQKVGKRFHKGQILRTPTMRIGYSQANLWKNGVGYKQYVHILVAKAFVLNVGNKPDVNHKNGIRTDNRADNLEWCTKSENIRHAIDILNRKIGETSRKRVVCLDTGQEFVSAKSAATQFGLTRAHVSNICRGVSKSHRKFKYV